MTNPTRLDDHNLTTCLPPDIALFTATLGGGGAERILINLATFFASNGWRVDLVVCKFVGELKDQVPPTVRIVSLDQKRVVFSLPDYLRYLKIAKPPIVLSSIERPSIIAGFGKWLSKHQHKLFIRMEGTLITSEPLWKQFYRLPWLTLLAFSYPKADGIFAISKGIAQQLMCVPTLKKTPIHLIYNPLIQPDFSSRIKEEPVYPSCIDTTLPTLIAVGRLHQQKDYPTLLKAFALVRKKSPSQLLILGVGPLKNKLKQLAASLGVAKDTHFLGFVTNPLSYIHRANVFVLSSAWEGLPGVLIEALTTGTPVISTDCRTGPSDVLENGRFGKLVPVGDEVALANGIIEILQRPKPPMSAELLHHLNQFKVDAVAQKYRQILNLPIK
ncbi:MAG: glycosyltransferase [Bdellovibrionales bacterium]|jgi:glycosyltransferase involved in cell wall biosynthesis